MEKVEILETLPIWRKRRWLVIALAFLGFINIYTLRMNLSVAIVKMTEVREIKLDNGTIVIEQDFPWDTKQRGLVLSSFFYGYVTTQILGGYFASRIGGNIVFGAGIAVTAIFTLLTPLAANLGLTALVITRVLMGIFEGGCVPCMHHVYSKWSPPMERSRMAMIVFSGNYFGMVIALSVSGVLAEAYGWESCFYVFGVIGIIWAAAWLLVVKEGPHKDKYISVEERTYIEHSLGNRDQNEIIRPPWKSIVTSTAVWAIIASHFSENWGLYTLLTQLPTFLKNTLDYDIAKAGFVSSIPYLAFGALLVISGYFADMLQIKGILTTTQVRKYFNCLAFLAQMLFMMLAAFLLDPFYSVLFITIGAALGAFSMNGHAVNHLDIAPQYASVLMGISNTFGSMPGIISPLLTGFIVQNESVQEWQTVFYITAGFYLFGCIVYFFFASGEVQSWAKTPSKEEEYAVEHVDKISLDNKTD